ncbi:hypothetical protein AABD41_01795 [Staphylococcus pseudoxylosus]|uniref:hypothetical protein n=1 Tax=Staphylococcus pseudoxylosus TaxID=2282419 RepID=UPI00398A9504
MNKQELKQFIDGIFIAYEFDKYTYGLDEISLKVFDKNIFIAINNIQSLPNNIKNIWFKWTNRQKLQALYIKLHPEIKFNIYK